MSRIHPEAMAEMVEAAAFYEERAPGLGQDFFEELEGVFRLVVENPDTGTSHEPPYRRFVCRRFPFALIYRETPGRVLVLAVMHQRNARPGQVRRDGQEAPRACCPIRAAPRGPSGPRLQIVRQAAAGSGGFSRLRVDGGEIAH